MAMVSPKPVNMLDEVNAKLFSNRPVRDRTKHTGDPKVVVLKDYLYPSDHYGIVFDINFVTLLEQCARAN